MDHALTARIEGYFGSPRSAVDARSFEALSYMHSTGPGAAFAAGNAKGPAGFRRSPQVTRESADDLMERTGAREGAMPRGSGCRSAVLEKLRFAATASAIQ